MEAQFPLADAAALLVEEYDPSTGYFGTYGTSLVIGRGQNYDGQSEKSPLISSAGAAAPAPHLASFSIVCGRTSYTCSSHPPPLPALFRRTVVEKLRSTVT